MAKVATMAAMAGLAGILLQGSASAVSPCCAPKPCFERDPITDECLTPNAFKRCTTDAAGAVTALPGKRAAGGCVEAGDDACVGGGGAQDGPHGCVGLPGGNYFYDDAPQTDAIGCTVAAVDGCCSVDACE